MRLLLLLAFVSLASADIGPLKIGCEDGWTIYKTRNSHGSCMLPMKQEMRFPDAFKACFDLKAHMLSFSHKWDKIKFVNDLIHLAFDNSTNNKSMRASNVWFFDPQGVSMKFLHDKGIVPKPEDWMVIEPDTEESEIKLSVNSADVPRRFICERPAQAEAQRAQFSLQPENAQVSEDLLKALTELNEEDKKVPEEPELNPENKKSHLKPLIITFNCHAYALPKPAIGWVKIKENTDGTIKTETIEAQTIYDHRKPMEHLKVSKPMFYDLRRDCKRMPCRKDGIQERSQLVIVGAQFFDFSKRIACVATNEFGSVVSREASITVAKMAQFPKEEIFHKVKIGHNITIPCELETNPDSASAEWMRLEGKRTIPVQALNRRTLGAIQMSKATFELSIDFATKDLGGRYMCQVRMHNGRAGYVTREQMVHILVEDCEEGCNLESKPISVVQDYPAFLSMNPSSNEHIRFGDDFLLECPCVGKRGMDEILRVEWMTPNEVTGKVLPNFPHGSVVMMRYADEKYNGTYKCRCIREQENSAWNSVDVEVLPSLVPKTLDIVKTKVGENVQVTCEVPEIDDQGISISVLPMLGTTSIANNERFRLNVEGLKYIIHIDNVKTTDAGLYGCRLRVNFFNKWTDINTFYTRLEVQE